VTILSLWRICQIVSNTIHLFRRLATQLNTIKTLNYLEMNLTPAQKALGEQLISEFQTNLEASSPDK